MGSPRPSALESPLSLTLRRAGLAFSFAVVLAPLGGARAQHRRPLAIEDYYRIKTLGFIRADEITLLSSQLERLSKILFALYRRLAA